MIAENTKLKVLMAIGGKIGQCFCNNESCDGTISNDYTTDSCHGCLCQYDIGRLARARAQCKVEMKYMYEVRLLTKIDVIKFKRDMFLHLSTWLSTCC